MIVVLTILTLEESKFLVRQPGVLPFIPSRQAQRNDEALQLGLTSEALHLFCDFCRPTMFAKRVLRKDEQADQSVRMLRADHRLLVTCSHSAGPTSRQRLRVSVPVHASCNPVSN